MREIGEVGASFSNLQAAKLTDFIGFVQQNCKAAASQ